MRSRFAFRGWRSFKGITEACWSPKEARFVLLELSKECSLPLRLAEAEFASENPRRERPPRLTSKRAPTAGAVDW